MRLWRAREKKATRRPPWQARRRPSSGGFLAGAMEEQQQAVPEPTEEAGLRIVLQGLERQGGEGLPAELHAQGADLLVADDGSNEGIGALDLGGEFTRLAGGNGHGDGLMTAQPHLAVRPLPDPGLCHGLVEVFEHIGGVPPVIVMDNATGAGRRNARGEVTPAAVLDVFDIKKSLSHKGNPYDNAVVESTNRPLKKELV